MNPQNDLPMGFGLALLQNEKAFQKFNTMTKLQQEEIILQSKFVRSKQEMASFVNQI